MNPTIRYIVDPIRNCVVPCVLIRLRQTHTDTLVSDRYTHFTHKPGVYLVPLVADGVIDPEKHEVGAKVYLHSEDAMDPCEPTADCVVKVPIIKYYHTEAEAKKHLAPVCPTCGKRL